MRFLAVVALAPLLSAAPGAAPALEIVRPVISQMEGGEPEPAGFEHVGGEVLFFSCRVSGFAKSSEDKIRLAYSVQAFDPRGTPIAEIYKNQIDSEVLPQDKEWQPKIELALPTPSLVPPGGYKIVVKLDDLEARTSAELAVPFRKRGPAVEPSGAVLWKQPEPALEQSESFYPKPYVQASMNLNLKTVKPAEYTMLIQVKDAVGNQSGESRQTFTVQ